MNEEIKRVTFDLPMNLYKELKVACVKDNCTMRDVVIYLVRKWITKINENK